MGKPCCQFLLKSPRRTWVSGVAEATGRLAESPLVSSGPRRVGAAGQRRGDRPLAGLRTQRAGAAPHSPLAWAEPGRGCRRPPLAPLPPQPSRGAGRAGRWFSPAGGTPGPRREGTAPPCRLQLPAASSPHGRRRGAASRPQPPAQPGRQQQPLPCAPPARPSEGRKGSAGTRSSGRHHLPHGAGGGSGGLRERALAGQLGAAARRERAPPLHTNTHFPPQCGGRGQEWGQSPQSGTGVMLVALSERQGRDSERWREPGGPSAGRVLGAGVPGLPPPPPSPPADICAGNAHFTK